MACDIAALNLPHWVSQADTSSSTTTILYWTQISPYIPDLFLFVLVTFSNPGSSYTQLTSATYGCNATIWHRRILC
jgi:hypothetical protein